MSWPGQPAVTAHGASGHPTFWAVYRVKVVLLHILGLCRLPAVCLGVLLTPCGRCRYVQMLQCDAWRVVLQPTNERNGKQQQCWLHTAPGAA